MKVLEIRDAASLEGLRTAWNGLLSASASNTIFLTWEWVTTWWSSYGSGDLRILAVFDDRDILRGLAPLRSHSVRRYGQTVPALSFIGDGSNDSEYLDFIVAPGYETTVDEVLRSWLGEAIRRGEVMLLNELPEGSSSVAMLKGVAEDQGARWEEHDTPSGTALLSENWEEYLAGLRPRFRTRVRSVLRNLEGQSEISFGFCDTAGEVEKMLPVLFDLHARRWAGEGTPGVFGWECKRKFYAALSPLLLERDWLRFSWLAWKGQVLACQYGFAYAGTYFHLQEGYEPASEHWSVGIGLRAWSIRELIRQGLREYDFLGGIGRHKLDWGATVKRSKRVLLAKPAYRNVLFCRGPEWESRVREFAVKVVPERLLAARRALARMENENQLAENPVRNSWLQRAAAQCYWGLHLSAPARPLRERYQLVLSSGGNSPRASWKKRTAPSGRILYYHRVNDDGDPFFPAHSTAIFRQQMEYLARYYKVVSLTEMLDRLEGGKPENLVAITFDDGYQDNYQNAFPILQRHGLPATIFLATEGLDERGPLWFERLALAVKRTTSEFLDLEIDLPRRFWLRTLPERLQSNDQIFWLLKRLPDDQRRQRLTEILKQLGAEDKERRDKMLTWDQVRFMKSRGVDFGGHTVTHPFISRLTRENLVWEVSECKRRIEVELQSPVQHFAYPNGREEDFSAWNQDLIRTAGYRSALTTIWGLNDPSTDKMELKRGGPWETSRALFAYKLDWYQLANE